MKNVEEVGQVGRARRLVGAGSPVHVDAPGKFHGIEPLERQSLREAGGISPPGQDAYTRPPGLIVKGDDLEIGLMVIRNGDVRFSCVSAARASRFSK